MLLLEEYLKQTGLSRRNVFYRINAGKLTAVKQNGRTYILTTPEESALKALPPAQLKKQKKQLIKNIKQALDSIILDEGTVDKAGTVNKIKKIVAHWQNQGISIIGYNPKSVYRKINGGYNALIRKTRADKKCYRNPLINKMLNSHILPLASHIYLTNAKPNIKKTRDLLIEYSRTDENFYEVAAIPPMSLYRVLQEEFFKLGMPERHELFNHYNLWFKKKAYVTGAFTDDIPFGSILMDDNKRNVASAWVYNKRTRKNELKQIKSWNAIESRTGKYLAFKNSHKDFNAKDVILLLAEALEQVGATKVFIDNGIAKGEDFQNFIRRLNFALKETLGPNAYQVELIIGKPYHPTDKAPVEGSFNLTKEEFDATFKNFVGDNHKIEGVHTTNCLTPQEADYTLQDYDKKYSEYIHGWYETRLRTRTINGKKQEINIRDYFNKMWQTFNIKPIPNRAIRYALQREKLVTYKGFFNLNIEGYNSDYIPDPESFGYAALPGSFIRRRFKLLYNPNNLASVDLYAAETIHDKIIGLCYNEGDYICTLLSVRELGQRKQEYVAKHNSARTKLARQLAVQLLPKDVMTEVNKAGQLEDKPKEFIKKLTKIIRDEQPLNKIAVEVTNRIKEENRSFSNEELDEIINGKEY